MKTIIFLSMLGFSLNAFTADFRQTNVRESENFLLELEPERFAMVIQIMLTRLNVALQSGIVKTEAESEEIKEGIEYLVAVYLNSYDEIHGGFMRVSKEPGVERYEKLNHLRTMVDRGLGFSGAGATAGGLLGGIPGAAAGAIVTFPFGFAVGAIEGHYDRKYGSGTSKTKRDDLEVNKRRTP